MCSSGWEVRARFQSPVFRSMLKYPLQSRRQIHTHTHTHTHRYAQKEKKKRNNIWQTSLSSRGNTSTSRNFAPTPVLGDKKGCQLCIQFEAEKYTVEVQDIVQLVLPLGSCDPADLLDRRCQQYHKLWWEKYNEGLWDSGQGHGTAALLSKKQLLVCYWIPPEVENLTVKVQETIYLELPFMSWLLLDLPSDQSHMAPKQSIIGCKWYIGDCAQEELESMNKMHEQMAQSPCHLPSCFSAPPIYTDDQMGIPEGPVESGGNSQSFVQKWLCLVLDHKLSVDSGCILTVFRSSPEGEAGQSFQWAGLCAVLPVTHFVRKEKRYEMKIQIPECGQWHGHLIKKEKNQKTGEKKV